MGWVILRPSMPFLTAAIAALILYRLLETGLGFSASALFAVGVSGAGVITVALGLACLVYRRRQDS
jgi:hypothetical protein